MVNASGQEAMVKPIYVSEENYAKTQKVGMGSGDTIDTNTSSSQPEQSANTTAVPATPTEDHEDPGGAGNGTDDRFGMLEHICKRNIKQSTTISVLKVGS